MNCPKCNAEFEAKIVGEVQVDECVQCHGIWFDPDELEQATQAVEEDLRWMEFDLWKDQNRFQVSQGNMKCPRCRTTMAAVKYSPTDVTVDTCVKCRGIWLDKGEFELVIDALEEEVASLSGEEFRQITLEEARQLIDGEGNFISDWRDFLTVVRLLQYRILIENPKLSQALTAFQASSPFK